MKKLFIAISPILIQLLLFIPYVFAFDFLFLNWFGCGCKEGFNANDFAKVFWLCITLGVTVMSAFITKKLPQSKILYKILYVAGTFVFSFQISAFFCRLIVVK